MIKIITGDARLDFAVSETLKEIKDSASLCGEFKAEKTEKGLKIDMSEIDEISNNVNNAYLKANGVSEGVKSYGKMVDLLLTFYNLYTFNN